MFMHNKAKEIPSELKQQRVFKPSNQDISQKGSLKVLKFACLVISSLSSQRSKRVLEEKSELR